MYPLGVLVLVIVVLVLGKYMSIWYLDLRVKASGTKYHSSTWDLSPQCPKT